MLDSSPEGLEKIKQILLKEELVSKKESLMYMEEVIFKMSPFITGSQPSSLDKSMFELLKYCLYEGMQLADASPIEL